MKSAIPGRLVIFALNLCLLILLASSTALGQEAAARLFITGTDTSSPPAIELRAYGIDGEGTALNLSQAGLDIRHNDVFIGPGEIAGVRSAGALTVFLIDVPSGVADQMTAIQNAIIQYASSPTMLEQVDYVAIYQVGASTATELLPPNAFYNGVRNRFATPLAPETGATALVDSMMGLLEEIEALKPSPDMFASMVVMSDGTDVVSTLHEPEDVGIRAAELNTPVHTIWLDNPDLSAPSQEIGQEYLASVAAESRGLSRRLDNESDLTAIWQRIAGFRDQYRVRYQPDSLNGGTFPVEISLASDSSISAKTTVTISANTPMISIDLPPEKRVMRLPDLDRPVTLHFLTSASWLDGVERQITAAQLIVNGGSPISIPVEMVDDFNSELSNLVFGDNSIQIAILDEQGFRVTSPVLILTILEGAESVPEELEPAGGIGSLILAMLLGLLALAILAGIGFFIWRNGLPTRLPALIPRGPSTRFKKQHPAPNAPRTPTHSVATDPDLTWSAPVARLEVLESISPVPSMFALSGARIRIGRSPAQSDISFEDDITVSRIHATLLLEGKHYRIFDERSTSSTWVNDQQVPEYGIQLIDGDEIHLGAVHLRFHQP